MTNREVPIDYTAYLDSALADERRRYEALRTAVGALADSLTPGHPATRTLRAAIAEDLRALLDGDTPRAQHRHTWIVDVFDGPDRELCMVCRERRDVSK